MYLFMNERNVMAIIYTQLCTIETYVTWRALQFRLFGKGWGFSGGGIVINQSDEHVVNLTNVQILRCLLCIRL
jgi:hypothetical protein